MRSSRLTMIYQGWFQIQGRLNSPAAPCFEELAKIAIENDSLSPCVHPESRGLPSDYGWFKWLEVTLRLSWQVGTLWYFLTGTYADTQLPIFFQPRLSAMVLFLGSNAGELAGKLFALQVWMVIKHGRSNSFSFCGWNHLECHGGFHGGSTVWTTHSTPKKSQALATVSDEAVALSLDAMCKCLTDGYGLVLELAAPIILWVVTIAELWGYPESWPISLQT